jgi:hypothetical protein
MAILVEGISVIVRRVAVEERYTGGLEAFVEAAPTHLYCFDDDLVAVAFGDPNEAEAYCNSLAAAGIRFGEEGTAPDVAIADQFHGLLTETDWLELARVDFDVDGHEITVAWLHEGEQHAGDVPEEGDELDVSVPDGWSYETSMSSLARFIPQEEIEERLEFVRHDPSGMDVYRDRASGEELYLPCSDGPGDESDG